MTGPIVALAVLASSSVAAPADSVQARRHFWLPPARESPWTAADKRLHAGLSAGLYVVLRATTHETDWSIAGAASAGAAKELHDAWMRPAGPRQGASARDLVADAVGIAAAALVWSAID